MRATRAVLVTLVVSVAAFAQLRDAWILPARGWVSEVAQPLLAACLERTGGSGIVEVRINARGMVAMEALLGGEPVHECVALVGARVGASSVTGGLATRLYFQRSGESSDAGLPCCFDTPHDMGWYDNQQPSFTACEAAANCGPGQFCHRAALDAGMCLDVVDLWRAQRRNNVGPQSPEAVHLLPRTDPRCVGVGTRSDNVIVRVVDTGLRPIHAALSVIHMQWLSDGGVRIRELPGSGGEPALTDIGLGRGFSVDRPTLIRTQPEGCSSSSVVIAPELKACVLLPVSCRE
ncbi:MAG: hypothetical protein ABL982_16830 [Vicinamibacterales bacterium]